MILTYHQARATGVSSIFHLRV